MHWRRGCRQIIAYTSTDDSSTHLDCQREEKGTTLHILTPVQVTGQKTTGSLSHLRLAPCRDHALNVMNRTRAKLHYLNSALLHRAQATLGQKPGLPCKQHRFRSSQHLLTSRWGDSRARLLAQDIRLPTCIEQLLTQLC